MGKSKAGCDDATITRGGLTDSTSDADKEGLGRKNVRRVEDGDGLRYRAVHRGLTARPLLAVS